MNRDASDQQCDFLFSFIIPAYNAEPWLAEAVESVIAQTLGFEEDIQIVLVNDGSTDGTGAACKRYRDLFPDNIVLIDKPHGGPGSARNAGLEAADGHYIGFLDADDKWDPEACQAALEFFKKHPKVGIACFPITWFGAVKNEHWLNYKFGNIARTANIVENPNYAVLGVCACFFRREAIRGRLFDESLPVSEDFAWIIELLLDARDFGLLPFDGARYHYRRHAGQASLKSMEARPRYLEVPRRCHLELLRQAKERHEAAASRPKKAGKLAKGNRAKRLAKGKGKPANGDAAVWARYAVMLDLTLRFKEEDRGILDHDRQAEYRSLLRDCLALIDDRTICTVRNFWADERLCALALKHGVTYEQAKEWVRPDERENALCFCRPGAESLSFTRLWELRVEHIECVGRHLLLRGACAVLVAPPERMQLVLRAELPDGSVREHLCEKYKKKIEKNKVKKKK